MQVVMTDIRCEVDEYSRSGADMRVVVMDINCEVGEYSQY